MLLFLLCLAFVAFISIATISIILAIKTGDFKKYKRDNPDLILKDGTVICKYCGSHKTAIYKKQKRCQTCTKVLYNA